MRSFWTSTETWVTTALGAVSLAFFISARRLPEGVFEPLGPGAAPEMVAGLLFSLCSIVLVRAFLRARQGSSITEASPIDTLERLNEPTPGHLGWFFGFLLIYVLVFQFELAHFIPATAVFVTLTITAMLDWNLRKLPLAAVIGTTLSVFLFFALTRFFVIRLPGAF